MTDQHFKYQSAMPEGLMVDFDQAPFIVIWEITQACNLACVHCRAEAQPKRHPLELSTEEGFRLLDEIKRFGDPLFVITGGDPLMREDVFDFIDYGHKIGLRVAVTPSATPLLTRENIARMSEKGISRMAISLDGATADTHDKFRAVEGSFDITMNAINACRDLNVPLQINTTVTRQSRPELGRIAEMVKEFGAVLWSVFFLVPTGRGEEKDEVTPEEYEDVLNWLYDTSLSMPYNIKTTACTHYRRIILQRKKAEKLAQMEREGKVIEERDGNIQGPGFAIFKDGMNRAIRAVNDGSGFVFISHTGDIFPSGFLPIKAGNVRTDSLVSVYRDAPLFKDLRDVEKLKGKCGVCEYKKLCGGSRARAYAVTGDYLAEEPYCTYIPVKWKKQQAG